MKLLVLSDLHLEFHDFTLPASGYDVAILAGDIGAPGEAALAWAERSLPTGAEAIFVPGNHEYYGRELTAERARIAAPAGRVRVLDGASAVIGGVRFVGCTLWTDFELPIAPAGGGAPVNDAVAGMASCADLLADYRCIRLLDAGAERLLLPEDTLALHRAERAWLLAALREPFDGPTVVVTHHAPHRGSLAPKFARDPASTGFVSELPGEFFEVPVLWVHGHTHHSFDYRVGGCRVVCNPRGYPLRRGRVENDAFRAGLVIEP